jgi:hypothetical protein
MNLLNGERENQRPHQMITRNCRFYPGEARKIRCFCNCLKKLLRSDFIAAIVLDTPRGEPMNNHVKKCSPSVRWEVIYSDPGAWRSGIYRPDAIRPDEIDALERHSCPELFVCMEGRAGLLLWDGQRERAVDFKPGDALLVEEYHNGYRTEENGFFLVIERTSFVTEYIDRSTRKITKTVHV